MSQRLLVALLVGLLLLPAAALAASSSVTVSVSQADAPEEDTVRRVEAWYDDAPKSRYLFLPSGWDASALRVWIDGAESIAIDGVAISSGETTDVLRPGETVQVTYGRSGGFTLTVMQSENVNSVFINTASGTLKKIHANKVNSETGEIAVLDAEGALVCRQSLEQVRCRGNSSFRYFSKKSYQFKLTEKQDLFGMGEDKTWLLIGNGRDRSHLRNYITAAMATAAGLEYTP